MNIWEYYDKTGKNDKQSIENVDLLWEMFYWMENRHIIDICHMFIYNKFIHCNVKTKSYWKRLKIAG